MVPSSRKEEAKKFFGPWLAPTTLGNAYGQSDVTQIPKQNGLLARNVQYFGDGSVQARLGNASVGTLNDNIGSMINWLPVVSLTPSNYLVWLAVGVGVKRVAVGSFGAGTTIMTETSSVAASLQPQGNRLYAGFMDANGVGVAAGQVYDTTNAASDPLFAAPITTVPVITEPGAAVPGITAGAKNFGYLIETRNGFITVPCPVVSSSDNTFVATAFTATGGLVIRVRVTATWPTYAKNILLLMTTTANPNQYFVGPDRYPVTGSVLSTVDLLFYWSDDFIANNFTEASQYFNQLSRTGAGTNPLNPAVITPYGQRMCYTAIDASGIPVCYISQSGNPQQVSAAFGGVYLPGNLQLTSQFVLGSTLYLIGPHWTFSTSDNNGDPATWAQPKQVDGLIGCGGPFCVSVSTSQTYAWVADDTGLFLFTGAYPDRPVSYYQGSDWARINFAVPTKIFVVDDKPNLRVHVIAPLDGATTPTHILTWDYSMRTSDAAGMNVAPEAVKYSLDDIAGYNIGAGCMVQNGTTHRSERWLGSRTSGSAVLRQKLPSDTNPFRDNASAIDSRYQTSPAPHGSIGQVYQHHGSHMRITGGSTVQLTAYSFDGTVATTTAALSPISATPGVEILQQYSILSEGSFIQIDNANTLDAWFRLSGLIQYFTDSFPQR